VTTALTSTTKEHQTKKKTSSVSVSFVFSWRTYCVWRRSYEYLKQSNVLERVRIIVPEKGVS